jgi:uncharacterized protein YecE (DUF72 family)
MCVITRTAIRVGTAAWSMRADRQAGAEPASMLTRYALMFDATEVNSTFYRLPRPATIERWVESTPEHFRFAVKLPRTITHVEALGSAPAALAGFVQLVHRFGGKLGPLLVQLPPRLAFLAQDAARFFDLLRGQFAGPVVCEPRHVSWFTPEGEAMLTGYDIAGVEADPARHAWQHPAQLQDKVLYVRLHGHPRIYYSAYAEAYIAALAARLAARRREQTWCIFDNTASGAAFDNALALARLLGKLPKEAVQPNGVAGVSARRVTSKAREPVMSSRAAEFVRQWAADNLHPQAFINDRDPDGGPMDNAEACLAAAEAAGIPASEIEASVGDLQAYFATSLEGTTLGDGVPIDEVNKMITGDRS